MNHLLSTVKSLSIGFIGTVLAWLDFAWVLAYFPILEADINYLNLWLELLGRVLSLVFVGMAIYYLQLNRNKKNNKELLRDKLADLTL